MRNTFSWFFVVSLAAIFTAISFTGCGGGGGGSNSSSGSKASSSSSGDTMSGTYEAKDADGTIVTLKFLADHKVHMTMTDPSGKKDEMDGIYQKNADHVVVTTPGGMAPLVMDLKNGNLEGGIGMGNAMIFFKK
jgi:hypothetical protein